jgi:hypothetical protein
MLRFQTHPDMVFMAIPQESMAMMIDQLREMEGDLSSAGDNLYGLENLLPNAGRVFNTVTAMNTFGQLLRCHREDMLFHMNNYHFLILYDTLQHYCEIRNDMVRTSDDLREKEKLTVIGGVHIEVINFDDLIAIYFFDIDFLLRTETVIGLGLDRRSLLGIHNETFGISQGLTPHPEELELKAGDHGKGGQGVRA